MASTCISADSPEPPSSLSEPTDRAPHSRKPYGKGDNLENKYRLEALLGRGGMGEVWTARNETLGVVRAVKLIRADAGNAESTDRLLHEARAAASLADPAIVRVFDFGRTGTGDPYIVMEMLEGEDLMSIINRRDRLSAVKAVRLLLPLIRALGTAHSHGIVHRDLKPENIFLAKLADGRVQPKLLDFGIAKLKDARSLRLTTAGEVMGSPLYMAPEQARGEEVDERVDIWAVCVVLYETLTGEPPFCGDDRAEVFRALNGSEPKSLVAHGVGDTALWEVMLRGLSKNREDRYPCMRELGKALALWLLERGVTDDITGASLEAGWLRHSPQSLFASSLPPGRRVGSASRVAESLLRRARRAVHRLGHSSQATRWLFCLSRPRRWALVGTLALAGGVGIGFASEPDDRIRTRSPAPTPAAVPTAVPTAQPPPEPVVIAQPPSSPQPEPTVQASEPPPPKPVDTTPERPKRATAGDKRRRRSKLLNPYE